MLKWTEFKIPNSEEINYLATVGQLVICVEEDFWAVRWEYTYDNIHEGIGISVESCKQAAEQWLKDFFMPIVKHTIAEVVGTEIFNGDKLEDKASDVLDAVLETISEHNYIENGEQRTDTSESVGRGDF